MLTVGAGMSTKCTSAQELRVPAAGPGVSRPPLEACLPRTSLRTIHRTRGWTKPNASAWRVSRLTHLAIGCLLAGSRPVEDAGPLLKCPDRPLDQTPYRGCPTAPPAASLPPLAVQRAASQMIFWFSQSSLSLTTAAHPVSCLGPSFQPTCNAASTVRLWSIGPRRIEPSSAGPTGSFVPLKPGH